jgi:8-hydroxy-5-deazaflavin:NADPH oxidoreductase
MEIRTNPLEIGIIGSGNIGSALTHRLRAVRHKVAVANSRGPSSLKHLAQETGAQAVTVEEAVRGRDVAVVTIPFKRIADLPADLLAGAAANLIVVDTNNYYPRERDGRVEEVEAGLPESRWVEQRLGHPVVKAFNNILAESLLNRGKSAGTPGRIALPVSGDDPQAKAIVMRLVDVIGFDPVDAGPLDESWRQQPGSPVYIKDYDVTGVRRALAEAKPERPPRFRATPLSPGTFESPA